MTVKELIEQLKLQNEKLEIFFDTSGEYSRPNLRIIGGVAGQDEDDEELACVVLYSYMNLG